MTPRKTIVTLRENMDFLRLGDFNKGAPKPKTGGPGTDLQFFRFTPRNNSEALKEEFVELFGKTPGKYPDSVLNVQFLFRRMEDVWDLSLKRWGNGLVMSECDGEEIFRYINEDGRYVNRCKPCEYPECGCSPNGTLLFTPSDWMVEGTDEVKPGFIRAFIGGWKDVRNVRDALMFVESVTARKYGEPDLRGVPFLLYRRPEKTTYPNEGGRGEKEDWVVHLEPEPGWVEDNTGVLMLEQREVPQLENGRTKLIEGDVETEVQ